MDDNKAYWSKIVTKILKAELAKRGVGYPTLVVKLQEINVNIRSV